MSSDDRGIRGLFYLIGWFLIVPFALAAWGSSTLGIVGIILGLAVATAIGVGGYWAYLRWSPANKRGQSLD